jgi:hypothetical protein
MSAEWPPVPFRESDLHRDPVTRLPTQIYPFRMKLVDGVWIVMFDLQDLVTPPKSIGQHAKAFSAFRIMLTAYEAWFPTRPIERVYFIGDDLRAGRMVKIGFSIDPAARLRQLQTSSPERLRIFATVPGGKSVEEKYHRRWSARRRAGEWFILGDCILAEIERLNAREDAA